MKKFEYDIRIYPGWDRRISNDGIHGCEAVFILKSNEGVVTFACFTDWFPKQVQEEYGNIGRRTSIGVQPVVMDLTCHSPIPYPSSLLTAKSRTDCPYLPGTCYSKRTNSLAVNVRDVLLKEGTEGLWREMERYYRSEFSILLSTMKRKRI